MKPFRSLLASVVTFALLASCTRGLPPSLERDIGLEADRVQSARHQIKKSETALDNGLAKSPSLFSGVSEVAAWKADLGRANGDLQAAESDGRELANLLERNRPDQRIFRLLADERMEREKALNKSQSG